MDWFAEGRGGGELSFGVSLMCVQAAAVKCGWGQQPACKLPAKSVGVGWVRRGLGQFGEGQSSKKGSLMA